MLPSRIPNGIDDEIKDIRTDPVLICQLHIFGIRQLEILPGLLEDSAEGAEPTTAQGDCQGADCPELVLMRALEQIPGFQGVLCDLGNGFDIRGGGSTYVYICSHK